MKSEAGRRHAGPIRQNGKHLCVQELQARPRKRVLDRAPGQFMPIGERAVLVSHHADAQATLDTLLGRPDGLLEQPRFRLARDDADELGDLARRRR